MDAVVGCAWQDMNNDQLLDLVLARHGKQSLIYYQTAAGGFDDGAGGTGAFTFGPQYGFSGLAVFDYNNDGRLDYLGLSNSSTRPPELYENVLAVPRPEFLELPSAVGLSDVGYVHGAVATDFGGPGQAPDGVTDLFLGRPTASGKFYFKGTAYDPVDLDIHYTLVRLVGVSGVVNKTGIGATVEVQAGSLRMHAMAFIGRKVGLRLKAVDSMVVRTACTCLTKEGQVLRTLSSILRSRPL